ncbi:MAG TPA: hypothetical protein VF628_10225 [Allosphingosinicella sp.]
METTRLKPGALAPMKSDRITVTEEPAGTFKFRGVSTKQDGFPAHPVVTSSVNPQEFPTYARALAAGLAWAERNKVEQLYVESAGTQLPSEGAPVAEQFQW